jgi:hypothetical protein
VTVTRRSNQLLALPAELLELQRPLAHALFENVPGNALLVDVHGRAEPAHDLSVGLRNGSACTKTTGIRRTRCESAPRTGTGRRIEGRDRKLSPPDRGRRDDRVEPAGATGPARRSDRCSPATAG